MHYSRRRQLAAEARARRAARTSERRSSLGLPSGGRGLPYGAAVSGADTSSPEAEAEKIVRVLSERATAAKAEAVWAAGTGQAGTGQAGTGQAAGAEAAGAGAGAAGETGPASPAGGTTAVATTGWTEPLNSTWSGRAIAALVIPALILLVVCLL